jgi:hypothetical protein
VTTPPSSDDTTAPPARRTNRSTVVALIAGLCGVVAIAAAVTLFVVNRDTPGHPTGEDEKKPLAVLLHVGDCVIGLTPNAGGGPVRPVPCSRPHDGETVGEVRLDPGPFPADVMRRTDQACDRKGTNLIKSRYTDQLKNHSVPPTKASWDGGDRRGVCLLHFTAGTLSVPLAQTLDPNRKFWYELNRGDCLGPWLEVAPVQITKPCDEQHWTEVYAVYRLPSGPFPGEKALRRQVKSDCDDLWWGAYVPGHAPEFLRTRYPLEELWKSGIRTAVCLGEGKEPMKKSMMAR